MVTRRILALESATDWLSIALLEGDRVVRLDEATGTRRHASALMPLVANALEAAGWSLDALDALVVSAGPGSFTSLRIGLATAKGLAFGRALEAVGVSTLESVALAATDEPESAESPSVLAVLDARRGECYAGAWRRDGDGLGAPVLQEGLYSPGAIASALKGPVIVVCPDRIAVAERLAAAGVAVVQRIEGEAARPRADRTGRLGVRALADGRGGPVEDLAARYLRRAEAEATRLGEPVEAGEVARIGNETA